MKINLTEAIIILVLTAICMYVIYKNIKEKPLPMQGEKYRVYIDEEYFYDVQIIYVGTEKATVKIIYSQLSNVSHSAPVGSIEFVEIKEIIKFYVKL